MINILFKKILTQFSKQRHIFKATETKKLKCTDLVANAMHFATGRLYVQDYFSREAKKSVNILKKIAKYSNYNYLPFLL